LGLKPSDDGIALCEIGFGFWEIGLCGIIGSMAWIAGIRVVGYGLKEDD
jgi:hypothetical protein